MQKNFIINEYLIYFLGDNYNQRVRHTRKFVLNIAYFISAHGFGHASRACAVMQSLHEKFNASFSIITEVPEWVFRNSLSFSFDYFAYQTDVGLIQQSPFQEDVETTLVNLEKLFPFQAHHHSRLIEFVLKRDYDLVICDISPIGIEIGHHLSIPVVLIENFTWDWIYDPYTKENPGYILIINYLKNIFNSVDLHIQALPLCERKKGTNLVGPIARKPRLSRKEVFRRLKIDPNHKMVLITMGGIPMENRFSLNNDGENIVFVFPVAALQTETREDNIIYLPHNHPYYHPDLVNASDAVIGKVGYSTIAEVYFSSAPFLYIGRKNFRETTPLVDFIQGKMNGVEISIDQLRNGEIIEVLTHQWEMNDNKEKLIPNGADEVAQIINKNYSV